jgi:hypothetical protein
MATNWEMNWLTPKAEIRAVGDTGHGTVATQPIAAGETVAAFGGHVVERDALDDLPPERQGRSLQIDEGLYLVSATTADRGDRFNHACSPTCGLRGATVLVAMRDIEPGEELTFDYATCDGSAYDEFACACGSVSCRGKVTGNDWMRPELQLRYRGWFSPYLARRIAALSAPPASRRAFAYAS